MTLVSTNTWQKNQKPIKGQASLLICHMLQVFGKALFSTAAMPFVCYHN